MCRMWWPMTLTYIFKVIWPWLWKSCLLCNVFSSRSIIFLTWDPIVWVIMRRRGVSSERRRSSCSSLFYWMMQFYYFRVTQWMMHRWLWTVLFKHLKGVCCDGNSLSCLMWYHIEVGARCAVSISLTRIFEKNKWLTLCAGFIISNVTKRRVASWGKRSSYQCTMLRMLQHLSCRDMCQFLAWLLNKNRNWGKIIFMIFELWSHKNWYFWE